jgi:NADPH:quinone reductase-like Zn-dependent oxidoreductase
MRTRAILIERLGPPGVLAEREVPLPDPGPGQVHVTVEAAGVNFADLMMREGLYSTVPPRPFSPGFEIAGRVARVGPPACDAAGPGPAPGTPFSQPEVFKEGDRVVALLRYGGYAHDVIVPADHLFPCPDAFSAIEAAAVPVVFLTAWVCLFEAARVRPQETVLVLGAGGGVGTAAVQLAAQHGLRVVATAGDPRKREFVCKELGAAACFDSRGDWEQDVRALLGERGLDVALDPVGGRATAACRRLLGPLGRLVFYGLSAAAPGQRRNWARVAWTLLHTPWFHPLGLIEPNLGILGVHLLHLGRREPLLREAFAQLAPRLVARRLRPVIDSVFPLTRAGAVQAHAHLHARRNLGKVVLAVDAPAAGTR